MKKDSKQAVESQLRLNPKPLGCCIRSLCPVCLPYCLRKLIHCAGPFCWRGGMEVMVVIAKSLRLWKPLHCSTLALVPTCHHFCGTSGELVLPDPPVCLIREENRYQIPFLCLWFFFWASDWGPLTKSMRCSQNGSISFPARLVLLQSLCAQCLISPVGRGPAPQKSRSISRLISILSCVSYRLVSSCLSTHI